MRDYYGFEGSEYNYTKIVFSRQSKVDSAMTAVTAGPGKSASQIYFYDWSENYRYKEANIFNEGVF